MTEKRIRRRSRSIKGTRVKPVLKAFNCKNCGSPVKVEAVGLTLNVVCPSCKSIIDAKDPNFVILQDMAKKQKVFPYITMGSTGKLKGILWKCIGFVYKQESGYYWSEYLLYNPYHGYRWLSEVNGHWSLYKRTHKASGIKNGSTAEYKNKTFKMFNNGKATVEYVEGEFYWRIKRGDRIHVADYVNGEEGLSVEFHQYEENWSYGHYIEAETIQKAFKIKKDLPWRQGVGMLQPSPTKENFKKNGKILFNSLVALFVIFMLRAMTADNEQVFFDYLDYGHSIRRNSETTKTNEFEIKGRTSNVEIRGHANVLNSWVYIDALLVDAETQKGIPLPLEISYYRGSDWKEGSETKEKVFSNIPPGRYYLSVKTQIGPSEPTGKIRLWLKRDVPVTSNFFIAAFLILIGPIFGLFRSHSFEVRRWSNSDYSPYETE